LGGLKRSTTWSWGTSGWCNPENCATRWPTGSPRSRFGKSTPSSWTWEVR